MYFKEIVRTGDQERAQKLVAAIEGKSYMNFRVGICPAMGEFSVVVESDYEASDEEITEMLMAIMAGEIMR